MAQDQGLDHVYSLRVLRAFFQEDRDIGAPEILIELATEIGLDPEHARQALESGTYTQRHQEALRHAREDMQITSVPTVVVGEQVFRGMPSLEALRTAIAQLESGRNGDPPPPSRSA